MNPNAFHLYDTFFWLFSQIENAPEWFVEAITVMFCALVIWLIPTAIILIAGTTTIKRGYFVLSAIAFLCLFLSYALPNLTIHIEQITKNIPVEVITNVQN